MDSLRKYKLRKLKLIVFKEDSIILLIALKFKKN